MNHFLQHSSGAVRLAFGVIILLALVALTCQWWLPSDPLAIDLTARLQGASSAHWLGTDHLGRDIFSRLLAATRTSLGAVMICLLLVLGIGLTVGSTAGLLGGRVDQGLMRVTDMFMTFPTSILSFFYGRGAGHRADQRDHRDCALPLGLVCPHGAQPGDQPAPA
ncbi:Nickel transport system permease protein nikC [Shimwellia blattae]|nr:Nickel transport system permease protein nikC [Shimwellia blattae]